jgi:5'-methylthioadenosine phosphorylase
MKLGIIGGSGLYDLEGLTDVSRLAVKTPFGSPSDEYVHGQLDGRELYFLPRHGRGHRLLPSEIPHKANIYGFKTLGVECVLSVSAVGSLREKIRPRDVVLPDQYYDRTKGALDHTFFGKGLVAHVGFGDPACPHLRQLLAGIVQGLFTEHAEYNGLRLFPQGTYVNMEGPAFSTRAESETYRKLGFDIIGMTSLPEAKLCREAELCYQGMSLVTDYDCWHTNEAPVSVEAIIANLTANTRLAKAVIRRLLQALPEERHCACGDALASALLTDLALVPPATREALRPIVGRYLAARGL